MGIKVLPPDVNESIGYFAAVGEDIRFGLGAVRNVGFNVVDADPRSAREQKGAFTSLPRLPAQGADPRRQQAHRRVAHQGRRLRLARAPRGARSSRSTRTPSNRPSAIKRDEANGQVGFDFDSLLGRADARPTHVPERPEWSKTRQARVRARDARALRLRPPARRARGAAREARQHHDRRAAGVRERRSDGETVTIAGSRHERAAPRRPRARATSTA